MPTLDSITITDAQRRQYQEEGYFVLDRGLSPEQLALLRDCCQKSIALKDAEMDRQNSDTDGINVRANRYFISGAPKTFPEMNSFLFSNLMADVCRATLGENAVLVWEQYVVKAAEKGASFAWHQDSGYAAAQGAAPHAADLSCWCALDDMSEENGTVYILPYAKAGGGKLVEHVKDPTYNDLVGYHGSEPGIPVIIPAGGIAVFSSLTFHRSGQNTTDRWRRVYLAQYAREPVTYQDGLSPFGLREPFLQGGRRMRDESTA